MMLSNPAALAAHHRQPQGTVVRKLGIAEYGTPARPARLTPAPRGVARQAQILELLRASPTALTARQVAERIGADRNYIRDLLRLMHEAGDVAIAGWQRTASRGPAAPAYVASEGER